MTARAIFTLVVFCLLGVSSRGQVPSTAPARSLTPEVLDASIEIAGEYLLNVQRSDGSFIYELDAVGGVDLGTRNAVREFAGLWGLSVLNQQRPTPARTAAVIKALKFYDRQAKVAPGRGRFICEPGAAEWTTDVMAFHVMVLTEFLATDHDIEAVFKKKCESDLADAVKFLLSLRLGNGRFAGTFRCADGRGVGVPSSQADGKALLALVRVAKQSGDAELRETVLASAAVMYGEYIRSALRANPHSDDARGFYPWGSMAFYELYTSEWPGTKPYAARTVAMARWMIDHQRVAEKPGNPGYAVEGIAVAWELARLTNDTKNMQHIEKAIRKMLSKMLALQIGSPFATTAAVPKTFLKSSKSLGGTLSTAANRRIRIDSVQHQLHAMMLARWFLFRQVEGADER